MWKWLAVAMIILSPFYALTNSFAAIASSTVFDISASGGDDLNGGGYNYQKSTAYSDGLPAVDYSNQDIAQAIITDAMPFASSGTKILLPSNNFPSLATDNIIHISAGNGFIKGFYAVTSIASNGVISVDRTCNIRNSTGGVIYVGGRWKSFWHAQNTATGPVVAGNIIYIASGTYYPVGASTSVLQTRVAGGNGTPIQWIGYTLGTNRVWANNSNRPILNGQGKTNAINSTGVAAQGFLNLQLTNSAVGFTGTAANMNFYNVKSFANSSHGFTCGGNPSNLFSCESSSNGGSGFNSVSITSGCYSHDNTSFGFLASINSLFCIAEGNLAGGYSNTANGCINSIAYENTGATSRGFSGGTSASLTTYFNNIAMNNGSNGFYRLSTHSYPFYFDYNLYFGNSGGDLYLFNAGSHDKTTNPLFINPNPSTPYFHNFTVKSGSPVLGAGAPIISSDGIVSVDYKINIGVDQSDHKGFSYGSAS